MLGLNICNLLDCLGGGFRLRSCPALRTRQLGWSRSSAFVGSLVSIVVTASFVIAAFIKTTISPSYLDLSATFTSTSTTAPSSTVIPSN